MPTDAMLSTICPEDKACIMPGLVNWVERPSMAPCMFPVMEAEAMVVLIDTSVAIFFRGGCDEERSVLDLRLFGLLVATLLLLFKRGLVD
uniref:Uncharacterized protein n=1 Tax=Arundo donax TaxID=35708 RepID=A0A0A9D2A5_ARUDO